MNVSFLRRDESANYTNKRRRAINSRSSASVVTSPSKRASKRRSNEKSPFCHSRQKSPLPSFPTPLCHSRGSPSVIPDVSNRESMVFSCWMFPSLTIRHHGAHHSVVMLALPEGVCLPSEPWSKTVLTGFPLKPAGMTEGACGQQGGGGGHDGKGACGIMSIRRNKARLPHGSH